MRYVTLTSVADSYHAYFVEEELAKEGIRCMIVNENTANIMQYAGIIGECVLIRVLDTDYVMARRILNKFESETAVVTCSNCGSKNVDYSTGGKNTFIRFFLLFSFLFGGTGAGRIKLDYRCSDCGHEFRKSNL